MNTPQPFTHSDPHQHTHSPTTQQQEPPLHPVQPPPPPPPPPAVFQAQLAAVTVDLLYIPPTDPFRTTTVKSPFQDNC